MYWKSHTALWLHGLSINKVEYIGILVVYHTDLFIFQIHHLRSVISICHRAFKGHLTFPGLLLEAFIPLFDVGTD